TCGKKSCKEADLEKVRPMRSLKTFTWIRLNLLQPYFLIQFVTSDSCADREALPPLTYCRGRHQLRAANSALPRFQLPTGYPYLHQFADPILIRAPALSEEVEAMLHRGDVADAERRRQMEAGRLSRHVGRDARSRVRSSPSRTSAWRRARARL